MARSTGREAEIGYRIERSNMANEQSTEACSALIEYWGKEYQGLFGQSGVDSTKQLQIPSEQMKMYIENYKKWYETSSTLNKAETRNKISILKRIAEAWQLNLDTINKLIRYMESTLAVFAVMLIFGCQSAMYQIDLEKATGEKDKLTYRIVERLDSESYPEDYLPVEVSFRRSAGADISAGLCLLTLGIVPAVYDYFETLDVTVTTPIGTKHGSGSLHSKAWVGWICFLPYPGIAEERCHYPEDFREKQMLENYKLDSREEKLKNQIVENLMSQFSKSEYDSFVRKVKENKIRELQRVQNKRQELEELIKNGKYEEVIESCRAEKVRIGQENPWIEISDRAFAELTKAIPSMSDVNRLVSLFSIVGDTASKDAIVCRLGKLGKSSELGEEKLKKYVVEESSEEGRLYAVGAISSEDELFAIAKAKYSDAVTVAAFKKINSPDGIRDLVWKNLDDLQLLKDYIEVFGNDEELVKIIDRFGAHLNTDVINLIRNKTTSQSITKAINGIASRKLAAEIYRESIDTTVGFFVKLDSTIMPRLGKISDCSVREGAASVVLKMLMRDLKDYSRRLRLEEYKCCIGGDIVSLLEYLSASEREELFDSLDFDSLDFESVVDNLNPLNYFLVLVSGMSKETFQRRLKVAQERFENGDKISFEGFYAGIPWKDFVIICHSKNIRFGGMNRWFDWFDVKGNKVTKIRFPRDVRYKLFEKEDGEFWTAYLRKYVPQKKKEKKSFVDVLDDAFDSSSFTYQTKYDDDGEYNVYKSIKYHTVLKYWPDSGDFEMELLDK